MTEPQWIKLEPALENDGSRYAWTLVLDFDNDWQDWSVECAPAGRVRFRLHVTDDMVPVIRAVLDRACPNPIDAADVQENVS